MKFFRVLFLSLIVFSMACSKDEDSTSSDSDESDDNVVYVSDDERLTVGTLNIRYSNDDDGENNWEYRREWVVDFIEYFDFDIIGFQEEKHDQTSYLRTSLTDNYSMIGKASSSVAGYEYDGIYYNKNRVELEDNGRFWLSETPDEVSLGWNAIYHRQVTWGKFKNLITDKTFYFFNTHFSHIDDETRINSAILLKERIDTIAGDSPVIATGDFNFWPETTAYNILIGDEYDGAVLTETRTLVDNPYSANYTGHCFGTCYEDGKIVDYVFVNDQVSVEKYGIITEQRQDVFLSDHYPVIAKVLIE